MINHFKGLRVVPASDVTHAYGTLAKRLMHMVHLSGNTSGMLKLSSDWLNFIGLCQHLEGFSAHQILFY